MNILLSPSQPRLAAPPIVQTLNDPPPDLWDRVVDACGHATFFHTRLWASIIEKTYPRRFRAAARAFRFADGKWALAPAMASEHDFFEFFRSYYASVPGVYGGVLVEGGWDAARAQAVLSRLRTPNARKVVIFGSPFADAPPPAQEGWAIEENFTHLIALADFTDEEALLRGYQRFVRNDVKKALRFGLRASPAASAEEWEEYDHIYREALARWGSRATGRHKVELFRNIRGLAGERATLWLARQEERVLGGVLCLYHDRHCAAWHAAFREDAYALGAAKLAHHAAIDDARRRGFRWYDFNPSGGHEGTAHMKEMFGARRVPFSGCRWEGNRAYGLLRTVRGWVR